MTDDELRRLYHGRPPDARARLNAQAERLAAQTRTARRDRWLTGGLVVGTGLLVGLGLLALASYYFGNLL